MKMLMLGEIKKAAYKISQVVWSSLCTYCMRLEEKSTHNSVFI